MQRNREVGKATCDAIARHLAELKSATDRGLGRREIAAAAGVTIETAGKALGLLEREGRVRVSLDPEDRRRRIWTAKRAARKAAG